MTKKPLVETAEEWLRNGLKDPHPTYNRSTGMEVNFYVNNSQGDDELIDHARREKLFWHSGYPRP